MLKNQSLIVDLHTHTSFSDGHLSVEELLNIAVRNRVQVLAITDHDTIKAIDIAYSYINQKKLSLKLLVGIELSAFCSFLKRPVHLLGYNFDYTNPEFLQELEKIQQVRFHRNKRILEKLKNLGFPDVEKQMIESFHDLSKCTRLNIAESLIALGITKSIKTAFNDFLGQKAPAYEALVGINLADAIALLHRFKGKAIMAHLGDYSIPLKEVTSYLHYLNNLGIDGIEIFHPKNSADLQKLLFNYVEIYNLLYTCGSDFHFLRKNRNSIGTFYCKLKIHPSIKTSQYFLNPS